MSDDIVVRLNELASNYKTSDFEFMYADYETVCEASAEIERLQKLISGITEAIKNEGIMPSYHRKVMSKHRKEWPTLWQRIDAALKTNL